MKAWIKLHARQLGTLALWLVAMFVLHYEPQRRDEVIGAATALLVAGFQLPPFTLKGGVEAAAKLVGGVLLFVLAIVTTFGVVLACAPREIAKDAYTVQSKACLVAYDDAAHQRSCLEYVRNRWTEAGAPPAAAAELDGGSHE